MSRPKFSLPRSGSTRFGAHMDKFSTLGLALQRGETSRFFYSPGSFPVTTPPCDNVLRLLWPLLTPAQSPCMLPYRALSRTQALPQTGQASPDKNVICHYTTAAFTLSPKPWVSSCGADSPGNWALCAVSVRRLIALYSGFLQTIPHEIALAFD